METVLFQNDLIKIGNFILKSDDPNFNKTGTVHQPLIVFPQHSIWIQHQGQDPFVADSSIINLYNKNQQYERYSIDSQGDYCHWIEISETLLQQIGEYQNSHNAEVGKIGVLK